MNCVLIECVTNHAILGTNLPLFAINVLKGEYLHRLAHPLTRRYTVFPVLH